VFTPTFLMWIGIFIVSLGVLIKSSQVFTKQAEKMGLLLGIPPFIVGVTIVAFGTSLPELVSSILAVAMNSSEIVVGNVMGSNITNIFLIMGCSAIIGKNIRLTYALADVDLPIMMASAFLFALMIWDKHFTRWESFLSLCGLMVYLGYTIYAARHNIQSPRKNEKLKKPVIYSHVITLILIIISGGFVYLGARYTVESIVKISDLIGIGKEVVAASAVALGTSLPELAVSIMAVRQGQSEMAVGNILGSNIFNTFAVMGIPSLFGTLYIPDTMVSGVLPIMIIASILFLFITQVKRISQWEGLMLIVFYAYFLSQLFVLN